MSEETNPKFDAPTSPAELVGFRLSTATVLFHTAVAEHLGLNVTDAKCYSLVRQAGSMTAGELATQTALTTGAITGVIDRLERAGYVRRVRDAGDRRRVMIEVVENPTIEQRLAALYGPMGRAIGELLARYSASEQTLIHEFLARATTIMEQAAADLRADK